MSDWFYFACSGSNNDIVSVRHHNIPDEEISEGWKSVGLAGHNYTASYSSASHEENWTNVWDEARRCPFDSGSWPVVEGQGAVDVNTRYRYNGSDIEPKANVKSIRYKSGSMNMNSDGTLSFK